MKAGEMEAGVSVVEVITTKMESAVNVKMSLRDAEDLRGICGHVAGCPETTPRGVMDRLSHALSKAGVKWRKSGDPLHIAMRAPYSPSFHYEKDGPVRG